MTNFISITTTAMTNLPAIVTTNADGTTIHLQKVSMTTYAIGPYFVPIALILGGVLIGVVWDFFNRRKSGGPKPY
jgi:hypothetical protein